MEMCARHLSLFCHEIECPCLEPRRQEGMAGCETLNTVNGLNRTLTHLLLRDVIIMREPDL